jgi:hypothetical protein
VHFPRSNRFIKELNDTIISPSFRSSFWDPLCNHLDHICSWQCVRLGGEDKHNASSYQRNWNFTTGHNAWTTWAYRAFIVTTDTIRASNRKCLMWSQVPYYCASWETTSMCSKMGLPISNFRSNPWWPRMTLFPSHHWIFTKPRTVRNQRCKLHTIWRIQHIVPNEAIFAKPTLPYFHESHGSTLVEWQLKENKMLSPRDSSTHNTMYTISVIVY